MIPTPQQQSSTSIHNLVTPPTTLDHPLVNQARTVAKLDFANHFRKQPKNFPGTPSEFFTHLDAVARTLARHGYGPPVVSAGYLHDHLEDLPKLWNRNRMVQEFGETIASYVDWVTQQDKGLSWEERNKQYSERIRLAPPEALAISAADKLSNVSDLIPFLRAGIPVSAVLKRGWESNSQKLHELLSIFEGRVKPELFAELKEVIRIFDELGPGLEPQ
jgi:(p)ppGpp synthase/HD superfamily hydrolase